MELDLSLNRATFRQLAVLMAMQGMLAHGAHLTDATLDEVAGDAVRYADALLEAMTESDSV
jgi:hypothetical protein